VKLLKNISIRKVLATLVAGAFFLFFWVNGPLQVADVLGHLEIEETEYATPILVGEERIIKTHGEVGDVETRGDGWVLLDKQDSITEESFGMISWNAENVIFDEEFQNKLVSRSLDLFETNVITKPVIDGDIVYVEIQSGEQKFFYTESAGVIKHVKGYGGSINVGLLINETGNIERVLHVSSKETESYLIKVLRSGYYNRFFGMPMEETHEIDAVSGATLTTTAVAFTLTNLAHKFTPDFTDHLDQERWMGSFYVEAINSWWWILHVLMIGLMFLYGFQKKYKKSKRDIRILSVLSVVYIGFFMNSSFTYISFIHPFLGTTLSPLIAFYALFSILGAIWGRNTYCSYVCPFGHIQRLSIQVSQKRFVSKFFLTNKWVKAIRGALTIVLLIGVLLGLRSWGNYEVFPDLFGVDFTSMWFLISGAIVVINLKYPFIWCRIGCPTGAVLDGISSVCKK
jgi:NosR/NirI family nitrous oxide reductase transcriptional regulator